MIKVISIISAVILGVAVMWLPILLITPIYQYSQAEATRMEGSSYKMNANVTAFAAMQTMAQTLGKSDVGDVSFPSSLIQVGLIAILGLIIALSASLYIKRRVLFSAYS